MTHPAHAHQLVSRADGYCLAVWFVGQGPEARCERVSICIEQINYTLLSFGFPMSCVGRTLGWIPFPLLAQRWSSLSGPQSVYAFHSFLFSYYDNAESQTAVFQGRRSSVLQARLYI